MTESPQPAPHDALDAAARAAARAWPLPPDLEGAPLAGGLINRSLLLHCGGERWVLQCLSPIFSPLLHEDIAAVTRHLAAKGLETPRLLPTRHGGLYHEAADGRIWRLMTYLPGRSLGSSTDPALLHAAGRGVARFHRSLLDLEHEFRNPRAGVHDPPRHLEALRAALQSKAEHPAAAAAGGLAEQLSARLAELPPLPAEPRRVVHGDLKLSNLRFAPERAEVVALLDLDTLGRGSLVVELGDALRSWCNPAGEDASAAHCDPALLGAALAGYAQEHEGLLSPAEQDALLPAVETIALELASRFCRDALEESYFGWDRDRYVRASDHNLARCRAQIALAASLRTQAPDLAPVLRRAFGRPPQGGAAPGLAV